MKLKILLTAAIEKIYAADKFEYFIVNIEISQKTNLKLVIFILKGLFF